MSGYFRRKILAGVNRKADFRGITIYVYKFIILLEWNWNFGDPGDLKLPKQ